MKRIFLLLLLAGIVFAVYWFKFRKHEPAGPKPPPIALKKHSAAFNKSVDSIVNAYLDIKNAFVEADTAAAKQATANFIALLDKMPVAELKNDTATIFETVKGNMADIRSNAQSLLQQANITEMRKDFDMVTNMMYPSFFMAINYEGKTLYYTECPMAFDDSVAAHWISNSDKIVNPYLGKKDPKYHGGMLSCGEVKDSIVAR